MEKPLRSYSLLWLSVVLILVLIGCSGARSRLRSEPTRGTYPVGDEVSLTVQGPGGRVQIMGGDGDGLSLNRTDVRVDSRGGDRFEIDTFGRNLTIIIPRRVRADILVKVTSGDLVVRGLRADVQVEKISGDVNIGDLVGEVSIKTTNGNLTFDAVEGDLSISSTSGRIIGRKVKGSLQIDSWSSDIRFVGLTGRADIQVLSGNVVLEAIPTRRARYEVETASGTIRLGMPTSFSARVELESSIGRVQSSLPVVVSRTERGLLRGVIGEGDGFVKLSSVSGNIFLYATTEVEEPEVAEIPSRTEIVEEESTTQETVTPTETPPVVEGPKAKLAVLSLRDANPDAEKDRLGQVIAGMLITSLVQTNSFVVVEREKLESVLSEQRLSQSGVVDTDQAKEIGRVLGVDLLIVGDAVRFDNLIEIDVRLLDTVSGKIILARSTRSEGVRELRRMVNELATEVARRYYEDQGTREQES